MSSHHQIDRKDVGNVFRREHFVFDANYIPLNHGSYGAFPVQVRNHHRRLQDSIEARSDPFIRFRIPDLLAQSRGAAARLLGAPVDDVVFVPNATTAVNTVLRNLQFVEGDTILYFSCTYGACEKTIQSICETTKVTCRRIDVIFPNDATTLNSLLQQAINEVQSRGKRAKIAMFDTIATFPGVRLPWERLVETCRELGVLSLIDGAHGIGHIDLTHLASVGPDFFTSNCYKWLYTPRACAVFYVPSRNQHMIRSSLPTSHGFRVAIREDMNETSSITRDQGHFVELFNWAATVDQTPYLCVAAAIRFREDICGGEDAIRKYCYGLASEGGAIMSEKLGTEIMEDPDRTLNQCCFANVRLPLEFDQANGTDAVVSHGLVLADGPVIAKWIMHRLMNEFDTWIPGKFYNGAIWMRLSAQMYLDLKDFEWAANVLQNICYRVEKGEWREE